MRFYLDSRLPLTINNTSACGCGRSKRIVDNEAMCTVCDDVIMTSLLQSSMMGKAVGAVKDIVGQSRLSDMKTNVLAEALADTK